MSPGITDENAMKMVNGLKVSGSQEEAVKQIKQLYQLFVEKDCTMVEVLGFSHDRSILMGYRRSIRWLRMKMEI